MAIDINIQASQQLKLEKKILSRIQKVLRTKVADRAIKELIKEYESEVYSYIGTRKYVRRRTLLNKETYRAYEETVGDMVTLVIDNISHPSPSKINPTKYPIDNNAFISDWIENGNIANPWNNKHYIWMDNREVFKTVESKLVSQNIIEDIIREELLKIGLSTK